jgi:hypothetical protein
VGLLVRDCRQVRAGGNVIRDDRPEGRGVPVQIVGGEDNRVVTDP